jgi:type II secretory ATPase GspE/PulE/Tfp pilus assembly ATPase PilB-like protein
MIAETQTIQSEPVFNVNELVGPDSDPAPIWEAIVSQAVKARVSDIHVMAQKEGAELAFRLDGDMTYQGVLPNEFARRMISHVKTMANIDLGENRRPTEGRMTVAADNRSVDLRVSAVPTIHGQDLVVRLFDRTISLMELVELGLLPKQLDYITDMIQRPHGLILVSGPTGCGKTTTLYAILRKLCGGWRKIITIENPVEYDLPGVNQTQVNPKIGVNFAGMLTAILRQDPDIIMVGEIRDEETAVTAVRAANTGHLVLATTHATRASRAVETMLSLGVHPYFLAVALRGVIAQFLVKRICPHCKTPLPETADMIVEDHLRSRLRDPASAHLFQGAGCKHCYGTGYRGRMGLFELFLPDENIRRLILNRKGADEIEQAVLQTNGITLDQVGKLAALNGDTTMEEVLDMVPML